MLLAGILFTKNGEPVSGGNSLDAEIWACALMIESMKKVGRHNVYANECLPSHGAFTDRLWKGHFWKSTLHSVVRH